MDCTEIRNVNQTHSPMFLSSGVFTGLITSRKNLDYEYADLRSVTLYVDVTDGFCDAATFSLTMEITDVNEDPVITPIHVEKTVYEGFVSLKELHRGFHNERYSYLRC